MSTITSHKLSLTCIRIHLKKCYVLLILLMMCSSLPMLGEEQYKWMKTLDKVTLERFQSMLSEAYHPDISNRIDSFVSVAEREKDWRKTYLAYKLKAYNLSGKGMVEEAAKSVLKMAQVAKQRKEEASYYDAMNQLVVLYASSNQSYTALEYAIKLSEKAAHDKSAYGIIISDYTMGNVFSYRGEPHQTITYLEKALENSRRFHLDTPFTYTSYLYLAQAYRLLLRDDKVKFCIDKAARLADNEIRRFNVEFTSALMLFDILDEGAYIELYQRVTANPLFAYIADSESRITLQTMYLIAKGQCHEALKELEKIENIQTRYEMKISALKKMKRYDMALAVSDTLQLINDSIRSILQIEDLAQAQSSIGKATQEKIEEEETLKRRLSGLLIFTVLMLIIIILLVYLNRKRHSHLRIMKQKNSELQAAQHKVEVALKMKEKFIKNMSHEIRTPLNQISGFSQVLTMEQISKEEKEECKRVITEQTKNLTRMLDNIILISNLESCTDELILSELSVKDYLISIYDHLSQQPTELVSMHIGEHTADELRLTTDRERLSRLMECLIDNAIKFTKEGEIVIDAHRDAKGVVITVDSSSERIAPELKERIFDRFFKVNEFTPGTGLGLSLARLYAKGLGATINLDTTYLSAVRFVVTFESTAATHPSSYQALRCPAVCRCHAER